MAKELFGQKELDRARAEAKAKAERDLTSDDFVVEDDSINPEDVIVDPEPQSVPDDGKQVDYDSDEDDEDDEDDVKEKMHGADVQQVEMYRPYGGATDWADFDEYMDGVREEQHAESTTRIFQQMMRNILQSPDIENKGAAIARLAEGFQDRLEDGPEEKSITNVTNQIVTDTDPESKGFWDGVKAILGVGDGGSTASAESESGKDVPMDARSGFIVQKDADGEYRWFGWVSNQFRDRDFAAHPEKGGEILSEEAHEWFVNWVWEKPKSRMPDLWLWHTPGTATKAGFDWIDYADGFLVGSGPLMAEEAKQFERLAKDYDLAMSHGLIKVPDHYDAKEGVAGRYVSFEGSPLPREAAANLWTDFTNFAQEAKDMGFTPQRRKFLADALGEDRVKELEEATKERSEELKQLGVEFKGEVEADEAEPTAETPEGEAKEAPEIIGALAKELGLPQLSDYLEAQKAEMSEVKQEVAEAKQQNAQLTEIIQDLQKSDDAKVSEKIGPRINSKNMGFVWEKSASRSDDNLLGDDDPEDEELSESKPKGGDSHWVKEAMGGERDVAPVPR